MPERWRVGRKSGHNIYLQTGEQPADSDRQIGVMFDPAHSSVAIEAVNSVEQVRALAQQWVDDEPANVSGSVVRLVFAEAGRRILAELPAVITSGQED